MPHPSAPNFTVITNWKAKGFACAKACSYCNWRQSTLLPHGLQSDEAILAFIRQCTKSFITISGGGDPLYRLDENLPALRHLCDLIHGEGYRVRIITREVGQLHRVAGLADYISRRQKLRQTTGGNLPARPLRWHQLKPNSLHDFRGDSECDAISSEVTMSKLNDRHIGREWHYWTDDWRCPAGHVIYHQDQELHLYFGPSKPSNAAD